MAESYVTKFTKYVKTQRDKLKDKLKLRGIDTTNDYTLGSLVDSIDGLKSEYKPITYQRDENLPNLDELFDTDPLRYVNGGTYKGCFYGLFVVDINGIVGINAGYTGSTFNKCSKIIFSDGAEYEGKKTILHTVEESGIYTDSNGIKYAIVKGYNEEPVLVNFEQYPDCFIEAIDDLYIGKYWYVQPQGVSSGYIRPLVCCKYYRYVGSNNSLDNIFNNSSTYWNIQGYMEETVEFIKISGLHRFFTIYYNFYNLKNYIDDGVLCSTSSTTALTFSFGYNGSSRANCQIEYIKLPSSSNPVTAKFYGNCIGSIHIPDCYTSVIFSGVPLNTISPLTRIHLGSGLTSAPGFSYNVKEITVSEGAFGKNTTAITIGLGNSRQLTRQSLLNIINNFADRTDMVANGLTISAYSRQYVTDEEIEILTNKNWTVSVST